MPAGLADLAPQARGVDEPPHLVAQLDQRVHRVHRRSGDIVHHRALIAGQLVQQRALAHVGLADQRDPARAAGRGRQLGHLGQRGQHRVEQIRHAAAVHRADRVRLAEPQRPQRRGVGLGLVAVNLVGGQEDWLAGAQQDPGGGLVGRGGADDGVDHQDHRVGGAHGHRCLLGHQLLQTLGVGLPSPGVLHDEPAAGPQRVVGHPVAGDARDVLHHRFPSAQDPVDQRRLADVGPADHRHHGRRAGLLLFVSDRIRLIPSRFRRSTCRLDSPYRPASLLDQVAQVRNHLGLGHLAGVDDHRVRGRPQR